MLKIAVTFGLIAGAIMLGVFFAALPFKENIGFDNGMVVGYASMVAAFLLVYFGIRSYRDNLGGGSVSFGRAMGVGSLIVLVASVFYVATWEVYYFGTNGGKEYMAGYQEYLIKKEKARGASETELAKIVKDNKKFAEMYENPLINSAFTFLEPLPVGILITLISAAVLRRKKGSDTAVA